VGSASARPLRVSQTSSTHLLHDRAVCASSGTPLPACPAPAMWACQRRETYPAHASHRCNSSASPTCTLQCVEEQAHQLVDVLWDVLPLPGWRAGPSSHAAAMPLLAMRGSAGRHAGASSHALNILPIIMRGSSRHAGSAPKTCVEGAPAALRRQLLPACSLTCLWGLCCVTFLLVSHGKQYIAENLTRSHMQR